LASPKPLPLVFFQPLPTRGSIDRAHLCTFLFFPRGVSLLLMLEEDMCCNVLFFPHFPLLSSLAPVRPTSCRFFLNGFGDLFRPMCESFPFFFCRPLLPLSLVISRAFGASSVGFDHFVPPSAAQSQCDISVSLSPSCSVTMLPCLSHFFFFLLFYFPFFFAIGAFQLLLIFFRDGGLPPQDYFVVVPTTVTCWFELSFPL